MEEVIKELKQAVKYTKDKEYKKAEEIYSKLNKQYPNEESVLSFTGLFYYNLGKYKKAEKYLDKVYKNFKSKTVVLYLGLTKFRLKKFYSASKYLELAYENNKSSEIIKQLLTACISAEEWGKGYKYGKIAHEIFPFDEMVLGELSQACIFHGQFRDAEIYTKKLLALNPNSINANYNLGLLQEVLYGNELKAREYYNNIVQLGDKNTGYFHLAVSYSKDDNTKEKGYEYLKKLKKLDSNKKGLNFLFASYHLSKRQFSKGYKYYVQPDIYTQDDIDWYNKFKHPWTGGTYKDDILLVYGDQGLGDQIQFSRYLPFLQKKFKELRVVVAKSLIEIFENSFAKYKNIKFYSREKKSFPKYNKSVQLASTIYYLNKRFNNIPFSAGYLEANSKKIEKYKLNYFNNDKLKIGICWEAGATGLKEQIHRTLNVELFEKIIKLKKANVYSFQVKPTLDNYKKYSELIDIGSTFKNFDDTAAALKNLDVLVTVDTSIAHLSGALGVKTFMLLPYCPDWRWFDNNQNTEWYDSVRIFKQKPNEDWEFVINRILENL